MMNLELMKDGYPPVFFPVERRLDYYEVLDAAHTKKDYKPFLNLSAEVAEAGFKPYWYALGATPDQA